MPSGLSLAFLIDRDKLPETINGLGGDVKIDEVKLNGSIIRAKGDAITSANEELVTRRDYTLFWEDTVKPMPFTFDSAPAGAYETIEVRVAEQSGPGREAFRIKGEARVGGEWKDFEIRSDDAVVVVSIPAMRNLESGATINLELVLDVSSLVAAIDFDNLPESDGKLKLEDGDPQLAIVTTALRGAFQSRLQ